MEAGCLLFTSRLRRPHHWQRLHYDVDDENYDDEEDKIVKGTVGGSENHQPHPAADPWVRPT